MKTFKPSVYILLLVLIFTSAAFSCSQHKKYFVADINITCAEKVFFDTLATVLFTDDPSDLGGKTKGISSLFGSRRVYKKALPKRQGHFFVDSVERSSYMYLIVESYLHDALFVGSDRNVDFSNVHGDTATIDICLKPGVLSIQ